MISVDFLGNGKSDRISRFPDELWIDQGHQIVRLCQTLDYGKVNLAGTSGGAYAAINAALEKPELFKKVVADSFDGNFLPKGFAESIIHERSFAKSDKRAISGVKVKIGNLLWTWIRKPWSIMNETIFEFFTAQ